MVFGITFKEDSLRSVSDQFKALGREAGRIGAAKKFNTEDYVRVQYLAKSVENEQALGDIAFNLHWKQAGLHSSIVALLRSTTSLSQYAEHARNLFEAAEDGLIWLASAVGGVVGMSPVGKSISSLMKGLFGDPSAMRETLQKIERAELEFEKVIAAILVTARDTVRKTEEEFRGGETNIAFDESVQIYFQRKKIPDSFASMHIGDLLAENPDIKRKGVMMGFNGEYWDPETQEQCTFYAAARRTQLGKPLPANGGWGNAVRWGGSAARSGLEVSKTPAAGDVFCQAGTWGHVGVVEGVLADGTIIISEANNNFRGGFSVRKISPREYAYWQFIK